jgi:hypothetical protein
MKKMNPELRDKWTDALRSGRYVQATEVMYDKLNSEQTGKLYMCCLGVLEHVCGTSTDAMAELAEDCQMPCYLPERKSPEWVMRQKHVDKHLINPEDLYRADFEEYLAHMNDSGKTFDQIADYIEKHI